ncbi:hypothetical protein [Paenibacillus sp. RC343]|uniref:hypothetical protein n=1 Tax=Paenibacillus sp. RC343 TaxID=3045841 RepID=UPI0024B9B888|nr:hypothetical protein [Paenibacillus sp. RC343]
MRISIKLKFSLFLAVLLILALGVLSYFVLQGVEKNQLTQTEVYLAQHVKTVNLRVKQTYYTGTRMEPQIFMRQRGRGLATELAGFTGLGVTLYDAQGLQVGTSIQDPPVVDQQSEVNAALAYALHNKIAYEVVGGHTPVSGAAPRAGGTNGGSSVAIFTQKLAEFSANPPEFVPDYRDRGTFTKLHHRIFVF